MPSGTQFVKTDGKLVAQSHHPCHLSGDGDILGLGVRLSFYIQFLAAIVALWHMLNDDIKTLRVGLAVLSLALFINLCINSTGGDSLVILNWIITTTLVIFLPFYSIWGFVASERMRRLNKKDKAELEKAEWEYKLLPKQERKLPPPPPEAQALNESYQRYLYALLALEQSIREGEYTYDLFLEIFRDAFDDFIRTASLGNPGRFAQDMEKLRRSPNILETVPNIYRDRMHLVMEAQYAGISKEQSRLDTAERERIQRNIVRLNASRAAMTYTTREYKALWRHDKILLGIIIATWMAYVAATPWIFFFGIDKGKKDGCNIKLRTLWAPISIYNRAYRIYLRVFACFGMLGCLGGVLLSLWLIYRGLQYRREKNRTPERPLIRPRPTDRSGDSSALAKIAAPSQQQVEAGAGLVFDRSLRVQKQIYRYYGVTISVIVSVISIVLTELTLRDNNVDLSDSPLVSTSQLLPLLIAASTSIPVLFHVWEYYIRKSHKRASDQRSLAEKAWAATKAWINSVTSGPEQQPGQQGQRDQPVQGQQATEAHEGQRRQAGQERRQQDPVPRGQATEV
ncbi:hypothetical protein M011DRAFT_525832 [Sporormia fimetaria CBS 119925]|uniref:Uncharacterized protein n=1 Tax=Sporormia fimetaria CBS 119925 TaxID=1340428 RepID=A0A6A6VEM9_9PLEO|nr:hypothetical protein M011DRAFT_525832 [Sporormia fimetaria CBS 119925]